MSVEPRFETKAEWVYARLRELITSGELRSGARLRLSELATRFATSPMPVREALRMLQRDGLVVMESHRGATVASVTWERAYEAVMIRMHLEVLATREAVPYHDARSIERMSDLLGEMEGLADRGDSAGFSEANRRFHTALYEPLPYPSLKEHIQELWNTMWRTRSRSLFHLAPQRMREAQAEHRAIVEAVRAGDPDAAAARSAEHRDRTLAEWRRVLGMDRGAGQ